MPMDVLAQAHNEIVSIDERIAALEKRKAELRMFVELGARLFSHLRNESAHTSFTDEASAAWKAATFRNSQARMRLGTGIHSFKALSEARTFQSQKEMVLTKAKEIIQLLGFMTTKDLIDYIESDGVTKIGGSDKTLTVSSILSRSDEFENDRVKGWSLKEDRKEKAPQDAATSAGLELRIDQPDLPVEGTGTTPDRRGKEGSDDA